MKKLWIYLMTGFVFFALTSCEEDESDKVLDDGLTREIHELVPAEILETIEGLGMPVYGGGNPPSIENIYEIDPLTLLSTNVPGDTDPGAVFATMRSRFYQQDNSNLTIAVDYTSGGETGTGLGACIVGDNNRFTVFAELNASLQEQDAELVLMFSGRLVSDGIEDAHVANFMIENNGGGYWIPNGTGRVFRDGDGHSGIVSSLKSLQVTALPGLSAKQGF